MTTKAKSGPKPGSASNNPDGRSKGGERRTRHVSARITEAAYAWLTRHTDNVADAIEALAKENK